MYNRSVVQSIKNCVDLISFISRYLNLKKSGSVFSCLCPFHDEKTPSFVVKPGNKYYHCFGCGAHGDVICFVMNYMGMSFKDAIGFLKSEFGIEDDICKSYDVLLELKKALRVCDEFFRSCLVSSSNVAKGYLYNRGFDLNDIMNFHLGFCPSDISELKSFLKFKKVDFNLLKQAGMFSKNLEFFMFFDRVMFPIHSSSGDVIAFTARSIDKASKQKYINCSDSDLFKKGSVFFNLNRAKSSINKLKQVVIVEGTFDVIRLFQCGIENVVAVLGSNFTESHINILKSFDVNTVYLAFDGDLSGINLSKKSGLMILKESMDVKVILIPDELDPDSFIIKNGKDEFIKLKENSLDYISFLFAIEFKGKSYASKAYWAQSIFEKLKEINNPFILHQIAFKLESITGISANNLFSKKNLKKETIKQVQSNFLIEKELISLILVLKNTKPSLINLVTSQIKKEMFSHESISKIYDQILKADENESMEETLSRILDSGINQLLIDELTSKSIKDINTASKCMISIANEVLKNNWEKNITKLKQEIQSKQLSDIQASNMTKDLIEMIKTKREIKMS